MFFWNFKTIRFCIRCIDCNDGKSTGRHHGIPRGIFLPGRGSVKEVPRDGLFGCDETQSITVPLLFWQGKSTGGTRCVRSCTRSWVDIWLYTIYYRGRKTRKTGFGHKIGISLTRKSVQWTLTIRETVGGGTRWRRRTRSSSLWEKIILKSEMLLTKKKINFWKSFFYHDTIDFLTLPFRSLEYVYCLLAARIPMLEHQLFGRDSLSSSKNFTFFLFAFIYIK